MGPASSQGPHEREAEEASAAGSEGAMSQGAQVPLERRKRQVRDSPWIPKKEPEPPTHFQTSYSPRL